MNMFLTLVLLVIGTFFIWKGWHVLSLSRRMQAWRKVGIDIEDTNVAAELDVIRYARLTYYYPVVKYRYEIDGQKIESNSVALDKKSIWVDSQKMAEVLVDQIRRERTAYCDPNDIRRSVIYTSLSPRRVSHYRTFVLSGIILMIVSVLLFWLVGV